jgi:hypothetical protein
MFACQWHFDIPFGSQKEVLEIGDQFSKALQDSGNLPKEYGERVMVGHIGASASHVILEHVVNTIADWEQMLAEVGTGKYRKYSEALAKYIVPGSQHWKIWRIVR